MRQCRAKLGDRFVMATEVEQRFGEVDAQFGAGWHRRKGVAQGDRGGGGIAALEGDATDRRRERRVIDAATERTRANPRGGVGLRGGEEELCQICGRRGGAGRGALRQPKLLRGAATLARALEQIAERDADRRVLRPKPRGALEGATGARSLALRVQDLAATEPSKGRERSDGRGLEQRQGLGGRASAQPRLGGLEAGSRRRDRGRLAGQGTGHATEP
jgi:hypothetical protein